MAAQITQHGPGWHIQHNGLQVQCTGDRALVELMAAAPELLDVLTKIMAMLEEDGEFADHDREDEDHEGQRCIVCLADRLLATFDGFPVFDRETDIAYDLADDEDNE